LVIQSLWASYLPKPPRVYHSDIVGHHERLCLVMSDLEKCRLELVLKLLQLNLHVLSQFQIQRPQKVRPEAERPVSKLCRAQWRSAASARRIAQHLEPHLLIQI
jgi:hypothetical protein